MHPPVEYSSMKRFTYHLNPRFEVIGTGAVPRLVCHCEHCGVARVPSFQVRSWLSEADMILLPGLDGWLLIPGPACFSVQSSGEAIWMITPKTLVNGG